MPKQVEECVQELMDQGYEESEAWAICQARFNDESEKD